MYPDQILYNSDDAMLTENDIKEELSHAYIHAISTHLGYSCERPGKDRDSIDLIVRARLDDDTMDFTSPCLEFQLKASSSIVQSEGSPIRYDLPVKNYNDLRITHPFPRLLALFVLPPKKADWINVTAESLSARTCMYWYSLRGLPNIPNENTRSIRIPAKNLLNLSSLKVLMLEAARRREIRYDYSI
jgi:Domain of unknown function (DUF4365)